MSYRFALHGYSKHPPGNSSRHASLPYLSGLLVDFIILVLAGGLPSVIIRQQVSRLFDPAVCLYCSALAQIGIAFVALLGVFQRFGNRFTLPRCSEMAHSGVLGFDDSFEAIEMLLMASPSTGEGLDDCGDR